RNRPRAGRVVVMNAIENVIELDRATIAIGGGDIFRATRFFFRWGGVVGLLGPHGGGQTARVRGGLRLLPPRAASLRVFGRAPRRGNPQIGYLPQVRTVVPNLRVSGFDFVASSVHGEHWGPPSVSAADRRMIDKTLESVGAADLARRPLADM